MPSCPSFRATATSLILTGLTVAHGAFAQIDVATERYDGSRLGANLHETRLTTANVHSSTFGKLGSYTVSGSVYAQPLYVRNVAIPGHGVHNVVYVVTMNDWVYAFDADSNADVPLMSLDLTSEVPGSRANTIQEILGYNDNIIGNVGIESTPHIDIASNTMFLVARTRETPNGQCGTRNPTYCQRLHALDISTLAERPGSPVVLAGSVPGTGNGSSGGVLPFDPKIEDQRASIAYSKGRVFIAWGAHSDQFAYHGWVMVYDATTLQQTVIWNVTPAGTAYNGGGIWMAGRAPAVDVHGNVYYITGNGTYDGTANFGESIVKFGPTADAPMLDWFTPSNYDDLNNGDSDLGGSGPILIPGTDLIVGGGKSGVFYVTHTAAMGHDSANNMNIVQSFSNGGQQIKGGPAYWNREGGLGPWMYVWSDNHNTMKAYHFNSALPKFDTTPASQSTLFSNNNSAGGVLTISANGSAAGSGILWSSMAFSGSDPNSGVHPGVLRAFNADDLTQELWNSEQMSARDSMGNWPKFSPPTVVNGRVYMASFPTDGVASTKVGTYGVLPVDDFTLAATPPDPGIHAGDSATYTIDVAALQAFSANVHLAVTGLPPNATASFASNDVAAPASTKLTVQTDAGMSSDPVELTITATSGALTHAITVGLHATDVTPGTGTISIDFSGTGTPMAATETAGVIAAANWNSIVGAAGSALALVDETGAASKAAITWNAPGTWQAGLADTAGNERMMNGYLNATTTAASVTVSNLPANTGGYYVYVYGDGDNPDDAMTASYSLSADGAPATTIQMIDPAGSNFDGTFVRANGGPGNYVVFFVASTGFTLDVAPVETSGGTAAAALSAIQIVRGDHIFANGFDG